MKKTLLIISFLFLGLNIFSQNLFYQDIFYGGVTGAGFSTGQGSGSGSFNLYIEPGSTIKKAFIFTYRIGYPPNIPITINSTPYLFDTTNVLMQVNHKNAFAIPINLYFYDFTDSLNANITSNFNVTIPAQNGLPINSGYWTIYIYIAYENPTLPRVATSIWINDQDFMGNEFYNYNNLTPIDNSNPVSLAIYSDRTDDTLFSNGYNSYLNANFLGIISGNDFANNLVTAGGVKGHFYYQNNTLFGLDDDTPDSLMGGSDGLADISSYIANNDTSFDFQLTHQNYPNNSPNTTNINLAEIITYTTPCDTFTTTIIANDTICLGGSVQLQATGGINYSWYSPFSTFNDSTLANPIATPTQTTTYICTIKNDSGCVKTEQVKIWVNTLPVADTLMVTNNFCGDSVGSLQVGTISNGGQPYTYTLTNLQTGNTQNSSLNTFNNLGTANYQLTITDINGCTFTDTATITETNIVQANFTATPSSGVAPLLVDFDNTSVNANNFEWWITSLPFGSAQGVLDTLVWIPACAGNVAACGLQYEFLNSGTYEVCLVAYNNIPTCADTICKTIIVANEISFVIPNVFTPNFDNENDNFVIQVSGASLIKTLKVEVFNRWGMLVANREFTPFEAFTSVKHAQGANSQNTLPTTQYTIWDGRTTAAEIAPDGTYFYVISYIKDDASATLSTRKGSITLLR